MPLVLEIHTSLIHQNVCMRNTTASDALLPNLQPQRVELEPEVEGVDYVEVKEAVEGLAEGDDDADGAEEEEEGVLQGVEHLAPGQDGP